MYKVFLVEDEVVIREGIKKKIDWAGNGYEFCGEASDGELAYPLIQKLKPDIVITDIKMPFMDGLELSQLIKKEMPWIEIIILSGFSEFEYAQKAISIGVAQFLSKPINSEELLIEVDKVAKKLDSRKEDQELIEQYKKEMEENNLESRRKLFHNLVDGNASTTELLEQATELGLNMSAPWYNILLLKMQSIHHSEQEYSKTKEQVLEEIVSFINNNDYILFDRGLEGYAIIIKADSIEDIVAIKDSCVAHLIEIFEKRDNISYFGGIGKSVNRLSELSESFYGASRAFARRYMTDENLFVEYDSQITDIYVNQDFDISKINTKQVDRSEVLSYLKLAEPGEAVFFVEEYFNKLDEDAVKSSLFRQYIAMDIYFCTVDFIQELEQDKSAIPVLDVTSKELQTVEGTKSYLALILSSAARLREQLASDKYGDVVDEVIKYIDEHYGDEDLSLNQVASVVNFSPNHLSTIFSQKTGHTFIKYLTDYRMNKAKELLKCTNKKSSIISAEVGYKDSHYFSFLFKKTQGMTPTQYRGDKVTGETEAD